MKMAANVTLYVILGILFAACMIMGVLSALQVTEKGQSEHGWKTFLLTLSWSAFGMTCVALGINIAKDVKAAKSGGMEM